VHAEDFLVDQRGDGQTIEDIAKDAPESDGIPTLALVVEAVDTIDLSAFVVTT